MAEMTPSEAATEVLRRRRARTNLIDYARSIDIPGAPVSESPDEWMFKPIESSVARHHEIMLGALQEVADGSLRHVMMLLPPGSAKSSYTSVVFPTYYLGKNPGSKIILTSYGSDLARRLGRKARAIVQSSAYRPIFGCTLSTDTSAADEWALSNGSEYMAAGILSGITGSRCVIGDTNLVTPTGIVQIQHIKRGDYVETYDFNSSRVVFRRVEAVARRDSESLYRVRSDSGNVVVATGDHPFWTRTTGWKDASVLAIGDGLLCSLRKISDETLLRGGKELQKDRKSYIFLRLRMWNAARKQADGEFGPCVQVVRGGYAFQKKSRALLLSLMQGKWMGSKEAPPKCCTKEEMRNMRLRIQAEKQRDGQSFLREIVPSHLAKYEDVAGREPRIQAWGCRSIQRPSHDEGVQVIEGSNKGTRWERLCSLLGKGISPRSPYRHECSEQHMVQLGDTVRHMPHEVAWGGERKATPDVVAGVERLCEQREVWDIKVEGTACFFANGILIHNCQGLTIDDPFRGRQDADSEVIRDRTWQAYQDDLLTRLVPGGWQVVVTTRWHEDDLAGRILPPDWMGESGDILCRDGNTWRVICIQAQCERLDDPVGRQIGEYLWPGWFSEAHFAQFKRTPRTWNALYQQVPAGDTGDYFRSADCRWYTKRPEHLRISGASDYAVTGGGGDYTEHGVFGVDANDDLYVLDWWFGQTQSDEWIERELQLIKQHKPLAWYGEAGVIRRSIEPFLMKRSRELRIYADFQWLASISDKPTRARAFQARWAMGKVYLPEGVDWAARLLRQLARFPAGAHDDGVDVCSLIGRALDDIYAPVIPVTVTRQRKEYVSAEDSNDSEDSWKVA